MWPEASRVRVFMPFPGVEVPHLCSQCQDYPCVLHPGDNKANICDLCGGAPKCVEVCVEADYNALTIVDEGPSIHRKLYSRHPVETAKDLAVMMFGEKGEEVIE